MTTPSQIPQSTQARVKREQVLQTTSCPGCGGVGGLQQVLPDSGIASVFGNGAVHKPWLSCASCGYSSAESDPVDVHTQVVECLRQDAGKGNPRGGGGNARVKRAPKPGDKLTKRVEQEPVSMSKDKRGYSIGTMERASEHLHVRIKPSDKAMAEALAGAMNCSLSDLLLFGLALAGSVSPNRWRFLRREADEARNNTLPGLVGEALEEWAAKHVPDVPFM